MAQVTAGETIVLMIDNKAVTAKVEDASKSDSILAKVLSSESPAYKADQVYTFDRNLLR